MKKHIRSYSTLVGVMLAIAFLLGVMCNVTPAQAETLGVSGTDYLYPDGGGSETVDILTVTGNKGDTIYININKGQEVIASHLPFTLDDKDAQADANGDMVGVVSVSFAAGEFSNDEVYNIEVFADRQETQKRYPGTISTVFALYEDVNKVEPLAVRTLAENETRPFTAPQTREYGGVAYALKETEPKEVGGKLCYVYAPADGIASSVEGHVSYFDSDDPSTPIKTETVELAKGETRTVEVPSVIASDTGQFYRTLQLTGSTTLSYPGITEQSVMCKKLSDNWGAVGSFYTATIKYVNTEGEKLGVVDTVIVNKPYTYTAPDKIFVSEGEDKTVREYKLRSKEEGVLKLAPGDAERTQEYGITYVPVADNELRTWTVVLENGSVSPDDPKREISRKDFTGAPGTTVPYTTEKQIDVDGVTYVPTAQAQDTYEHTFGVADADVEQHIYYVPDGYEPPEAYDVTVKYVNIANNEVIDTQTYTASPSMRADLELVTPATFSTDGVEWVRLNGQEMPIRHGFYSPAREYVVYYRDINDDLHASTVIRNVRVVYVDEEGNTVSRPTTVVDNGTTDAGTTTGGTTEGGITTGGTTTGGTTADEGAVTGGGAGTGTTGGAGTAGGTGPTDTGLPTGADVIAVDGADGQTTVGQDGTDLATQRIEDDETPLAGPGSDNKSIGTMGKIIAIGGAAVATIAAAGIVFLIFVLGRRRQNKPTDELSNDDHAA